MRNSTSPANNSPSLFLKMFGFGLWTVKKTKAEYEAERMLRMKKGTLNCVLLLIAMKFWLSFFYGSDHWMLTLTSPTIVLALSSMIQLMHLRSSKVVIKNKEIITQKLTPALTMLILQLTADVILSARAESHSSYDQWISSAALITAVSCHMLIHRTLESIVETSSLNGGAICSPCRKNPPLGQRFRERGVILSGILGYLYVQYCYATSNGDALSIKHIAVMVVASVAYECSAAKMVHTSLKRADMIRAQGHQLDNLLALLIFASSHLTLFRGYFCSETHLKPTEGTLLVGIILDLVRYGPQLIVWSRAFNLEPPKVATSWFSPCVVCAGKRKE